MSEFNDFFDVYRDKIPPVSDVERFKYCQYHQLLVEWSVKFNLVSKTSLQNAFDAHFVDSIWIADTAIKYRPKPFVDLGSGAGFPGLVLAIRHSVPVELVERTGKKRTFLEAVVSALGLNTTVKPELAPVKTPIVIMARAVMPPSQMLRDLIRQLAPGSRVVLPLTRNTEVSADPKHFSMIETAQYTLPISSAERSISVFSRCST